MARAAGGFAARYAQACERVNPKRRASPCTPPRAGPLEPLTLVRCKPARAGRRVSIVAHRYATRRRPLPAFDRARARTGRLDPQKINPALEIWVDDQQAGHLSWTFSLSTGSLTDPDVRRFWMSARDTPRVLNWESEIFHTHHGQVTGNIWTTSPQPPPPTTATANRPLADLRVIRNTDNATQVTGPDGLYGYTTGSGSAQITAQLLGSYTTVQNQAGTRTAER